MTEKWRAGNNTSWPSYRGVRLEVVPIFILSHFDTYLLKSHYIILSFFCIHTRLVLLMQFQRFY